MLTGSLGVFVARVAQIAISAATMAILARSLGPAEFGIYSYLTSIVFSLILPVQIGLRELTVREARATKIGTGFLSWGLRVVFLWLTICLIFMHLAVPYTRAMQDVVYGLTILPAVITLVVLAVNAFLYGVAASQARIGLEQALDNLLRPLLFLLFSTVLLFSEVEGVIKTGLAFWSLLASAAISFFVLLFNLKIPLSEWCREPNPSDQKKWRQALLYFGGLGGVDIILQSSDIIIVGFQMESSEVGVYRIGSVLGGLMALPLAAAATYAAPHLAIRTDSPGAENKFNLCVSLARYALLGTCVILVPAYFFGEELIVLIFGSHFQVAFWVWMIHSFSALINTFFGLNRLILTMNGEERKILKVMSISVLFHLISSVLWVRFSGIYGAAFASVFTTFLWNVALHTLCVRKLGFSVSATGKLRR